MVKYSLDLGQKLKKPTKNCRACGLYVNQPPVLEKSKKSQIFWVGLSAVRFEDGIEKLPLSPHTRSGALIETVELPLRNKFLFYKTNLVKCLPLKEGKIRYPRSCEMEKCYTNFEEELEISKPKVVFLLGKQVGLFVLKKYGFKNFTFDKNFEYESYELNNITFIPVHHPSFILVYKRKNLNQYIQSLQKLCKEFLK